MFISGKNLILIVVVVIVILIVIFIVNRKPTVQNPPSSSESSSFQVESSNAPVIPPKEKIEVKTPIEHVQASGPVLRCYDYFEFPDEGGFQVKTCGVPKSTSTKRLFLQWFPLEETAQYIIYCSSGKEVSPQKYDHKWTVSGNSYYYESDPLTGSGCWSAIVTAVNKAGLESAPSTIYSTC